MKLRQLPTKTAIVTTLRSNAFHSGNPLTLSQGISQVNFNGEKFMSKLLDRRWALLTPATQVNKIMLSGSHGKSKIGQLGSLSFFNDTKPCLDDSLTRKENHAPSFYVLRDDLLHPLVNGNKGRKLDALLPLIEDHSLTDVVTCGGCQSAHTAAVAVSCAERGMKSHLLLRGEQPEILTGYNLVSTLYGNVTYAPRSLYAQREKMLMDHASVIAGEDGEVLWCNDIVEASVSTQMSGTPTFLPSYNDYTEVKNRPRKVVIVNEGAGDAVALLGVLRLVKYLSQDHILGRERAIKFVVDAGTGTTAVGLGLGAMYLGLPWEVAAIMLADTINGYKQQEKQLINGFKTQFGSLHTNNVLNDVDGSLVNWVERQRPRKFGKVLEGETEVCQLIAQQTGILVDPVYTLAAWEMATHLSHNKQANEDFDVVMLHTGGTLGMFGLAQRYKTHFHTLKDR